MRNKFFFGAVGFFLICLFVLFAFGVARAAVVAPIRQDVAQVDQTVVDDVENVVAVVNIVGDEDVVEPVRVGVPAVVAVNETAVADSVLVAVGVVAPVEVGQQVV